MLLLLAAALAVRLVLTLRGGQLFFPDETFYYRGVVLGEALARGDVRNGLREAFEQDAHIGFTALTLAPAFAQFAHSAVTGVPTSRNLRVAGVFFSAISVGCVSLVYLVARRTGADEREALLAAGLLAASSTLTFWARHLSAYEAALALNLWSIAIAASARRSLPRLCAAGFVASMALMTYNGYWACTGAVLVFLVLYRAATVADMVRGAVAASFGFTLLLLCLHVVSVEVGAIPLLKSLGRFSGRISEGDMSEGWSLPWEFLWHAEHGVLLLWIGGAALAVAGSNRRDASLRGRALMWIGMLALVYGMLVIGSVGLRRFVVHGRTVHPMLPFLCLAAAAGLRPLLDPVRRRRRLAWCAAVLTVAQVAWNLRIPMRQTFPADFHERAHARYPNAIDVYSINVGENIPPPPDATYLVVNAVYVYPVFGRLPLPPTERLMSEPHAQAFLPYQYEGFRRRERNILRSDNLAMRVERLLDRQVPPHASERPAVVR